MSILKESIGSYEVKSRLSEILRRVAAGEAFTITSRGNPVADLLPSEFGLRQRTASAIESIMKMKKQTVSDEMLKSFKEKGRK